MLAALLGLAPAIIAYADDLEARAYSLAPVGTNFVIGNYTHLDGGVLLDSALPIKDLQAQANVYSLGYVHTFGIAGHFAAAAIAVPYAHGDFTGQVHDAPEAVERQGLGDIRMRLGVSLLGDTVLTQREFAERESSTYLGASFTVVAPTGRYNPDHLINVGANRWAFKPEIGASRKFGDWFAEGAAGVWLYTDNDDFLDGHRRSQDPLRVFQLHGGYTLRPGLWISVGGTYAEGGETSVDGVAKHDFQENSRYGATLGMPLGRSWSAKAGWSSGWATRTGGDFDVYTFSLLYHWFD